MDAAEDVLALHARAVAVGQRVVDGIRPDQLADPTPCNEWDVRAILDHLSGLQRSLAAAADGGPSPDHDAAPDDVDPRAAFVASTRAAEAALRAPGALDRTFRMPWGEMPGGAIARVLFMDLMIHSWDLAKATGQPTSLAPDLCETALAMGRAMMKDEFRGPGRGFGPEVAVPADAPACDRLAAFYGRRP